MTFASGLCRHSAVTMSSRKVISTYFDLAPERTPSFEPWGLFIRVLQVLLLAFSPFWRSAPASGRKAPGANRTLVSHAEVGIASDLSSIAPIRECWGTAPLGRSDDG